MKFKTCTCKRDLTSKDIRKIGRNDMGLWVNCNHCDTTLLIVSKIQQEELNEFRKQQLHRKQTGKMSN